MKKLSLIEKAFFLKNISLFCDLDLDLLVAIADKTNQDIYDEKEFVFKTNQIASRMYFIVEGSAILMDENNNIIKTLKKNDFFGDESIFNELLREYSVICSKNSLFLTLTKTNLMTIISECPSIAVSLLQSYSQNIKYRT